MPPVCHDFLFKKAAKVRRLVKESELVSLGYRWKVTTNPKERKICSWGGPRESPPQILCRTYRDRLPSLLKISPTPPLSLFFGHRGNVGPQAPVARAYASFGRKDGHPGKIHAGASTTTVKTPGGLSGRHVYTSERETNQGAGHDGSHSKE